MKNSIMISGLFFLSLSVILTGCKNNTKQAVPEIVKPTGEQLIQRGEYLVTTMGCNDCHSPKKMGPHGPMIIDSLILSGYPADRPLPKVDVKTIKNGWVLLNEDLTAAAGPWGVSFAANLTSDQSGIGNWTEENFKRALKEGKFKGLERSRTLLPPMPWANFVNISDEDISAIFAYLKSTKPVRNAVPMAIPPQEVK
jgi:mono/diheme cytochrome c family protein